MEVEPKRTETIWLKLEKRAKNRDNGELLWVEFASPIVGQSKQVSKDVSKKRKRLSGTLSNLCCL